MRRSHEAQELHERLAHADWMRHWAETVGAEEEPRWLRRLMAGVLSSFVLAMALWVFVAWATR